MITTITDTAIIKEATVIRITMNITDTKITITPLSLAMAAPLPPWVVRATKVCRWVLGSS